jgi:hypothetical protein
MMKQIALIVPFGSPNLLEDRRMKLLSPVLLLLFAITCSPALGEWDDSYQWSTDGFWGRDGSWHYFDDVYHNHEQCHSSSYYGGGGYYPSYYYYPTYYYGYDGVDYHGLRRFGGW